MTYQQPQHHEQAPVYEGGPTPEQKLAERRAQAREQGRGPVVPTPPRDHQAPLKLNAYGTRPVPVEYEGHTYEVVPAVLDDWEMIEAQAEGRLEEKSLPQQYRDMLGEEGYQQLMDNIRATHGYVSARVMGGFMQAVQQQVDGGNS